MSAAKTERLGPTRAEVLLRARVRAGVSKPVALALGLHPSTTVSPGRSHRRAGLIVRGSRTAAPGHPRMLFRAVPGLGGDHYEALAEVLVRHFASGLDDRAERAENAGLAWDSGCASSATRTSRPTRPVERYDELMDASATNRSATRSTTQRSYCGPALF